MLGATNHIDVEHRYFGKSVPSSMDWKQLTLKNSADDLHDIVTALKTIYRGKWVSTGTSKGGQESLYYKYYFLDDMDATVAYVAPICLTQVDPRINAWFQQIEDPKVRAKIVALQIAYL